MSRLPTADEVIDLLGLVRHEGEGGFVRNTIRNVEPGREHAPSNTAIYYLVTLETWSGLHRLAGDELFHFYLGDPCRMVLAREGYALEERILGQDVLAGELVQTLVPGNWWQGTRLLGEGPYGFALLGTTMTPGYREDQFELASATSISGFPESERLQLAPYLGGHRT